MQQRWETAYRWEPGEIKGRFRRWTKKKKCSKELRAGWIHVGDGETEGRTGAAGCNWGQM